MSDVLISKNDVDEHCSWQPYERSSLTDVGGVNPTHLVKDPTVWIEEVRGVSQLILRGNPENSEFLSSAQVALNIMLPLVPNTSTETEAYRTFWLSPDEWLIVAQSSDAIGVESILRNSLCDDCALTDVSGGQVLLRLEGQNAENVLKKSTSYDLGKLTIGKTVGTCVAKSNVRICRVDNQSFELIVRRSLANYLLTWLMDASQEYGVVFRRQ